MCLVVEGDRRRESAQQQDWLADISTWKLYWCLWLWKGCEFSCFLLASPACLSQGQPFPEGVIKEGLQKLIYFSLQFSFQTGVKISYTITTKWLNTTVGFICIILYNAYKKLMRQVQLIFSFCKWKKYWDSDNISWVHSHWQMHKHVGMAMAVSLQTYDKCVVMF